MDDNRIIIDRFSGPTEGPTRSSSQMDARPEIWFWQGFVCPLWAGLQRSLSRRCASVTIVASQLMPERRAALGWSVPDVGGAQVRVAGEAAEVRALAASAPSHVVHVCQGIRSNGNIALAQQILRDRGSRQLVLFETIDDTDWRGPLKKIVYRSLFWRYIPKMDGVLAIGANTPSWIEKRGVPQEQLYPFAYFIANDDAAKPLLPDDGPFRFLFVGQLIERKRLDLLIDALSEIGAANFELHVVGSGGLAAELEAHGRVALGDRLVWHGLVPRQDVAVHLARADCLVLPSRHDGWGAVVSESLLSGVPAIVSDRCGVAGIVRASGVGGVFTAGDKMDLARTLQAQIRTGRTSLNERKALSAWAQCIGSEAGSEYLLAIAESIWEGAPRPNAPWVPLSRSFDSAFVA